jgi:hypothetical protein
VYVWVKDIRSVTAGGGGGGGGGAPARVSNLIISLV